MLVLCIIEAFKLRVLLSLCEETKPNFTAHPSLKLPTFAQYKYGPKVKAVRVNGQITEVKHTKIGDHLGSMHFVFFQFG